MEVLSTGGSGTGKGLKRFDAPEESRTLRSAACIPAAGERKREMTIVQRWSLLPHHGQGRTKTGRVRRENLPALVPAWVKHLRGPHTRLETTTSLAGCSSRIRLELRPAAASRCHGDIIESAGSLGNGFCGCCRVLGSPK